MNEIRIRIQCAEDLDHAKILRLDAAQGAVYAKDLAELMCGVSAMYMNKPGDRSPVGRCGICGGKLSYTMGELTAPEIWEFDGCQVRATNMNDLALATEWTKADSYHAGLDPLFWLEQHPLKQSYLVCDAAGPVYFFKGVLMGRTLEVFIQFPPETVSSGMHRYNHRHRVANALAAGTEWLAGRMRGVVDEFVFDTVSPRLKHFCEHRLDFEERDGRLRRRISETARAGR